MDQSENKTSKAKRSFSQVLKRIDAIRRREGTGNGRLRRFEVARRVSLWIIGDMKKRGRFLREGKQAYYFWDEKKRVLTIEKDSDQLGLFLMQYGIPHSDPIFKTVLDFQRYYAVTFGTETSVYTFAHLNTDTWTLYLYNFDHQVYRITKGTTELVDNGTDGVLFLHHDAWQPFKLVESRPGLLAEKIIPRDQFHDESLSAADQNQLFWYWFHSLFLPELFPTRPILAHIGEQGGEKTFTLRRVGQLIFGPNFNVMQVVTCRLGCVGNFKP